MLVDLKEPLITLTGKKCSDIFLGIWGQIGQQKVDKHIRRRGKKRSRAVVKVFYRKNEGTRQKVRRTLSGSIARTNVPIFF